MNGVATRSVSSWAGWLAGWLIGALRIPKKELLSTLLQSVWGLNKSFNFEFPVRLVFGELESYVTV